jgi:hypothetical protein
MRALVSRAWCLRGNRHRLAIERQNHDGFEKRFHVFGVPVGVLAAAGTVPEFCRVHGTLWSCAMEVPDT